MTYFLRSPGVKHLGILFGYKLNSCKNNNDNIQFEMLLGLRIIPLHFEELTFFIYYYILSTVSGINKYLSNKCVICSNINSSINGNSVIVTSKNASVPYAAATCWS